MELSKLKQIIKEEIQNVLNEARFKKGTDIGKKGKGFAKIAKSAGENILKENGEEYPPYMYSKVGFGCHVCKYLEYNKDESKYTCGNTNYQEYMGTYFLIDPNTKEPVAKENLNKYCSNWFLPKGK